MITLQKIVESFVLNHDHLYVSPYVMYTQTKISDIQIWVIRKIFDTPSLLLTIMNDS